MKKINLFLTVLFASLYVCAQETQVVPEYPVQRDAMELVPTDSMGVHPYDGKENDSHIVIPTQSHWSMYLAGGFNLFDGDFISEQKSIIGFPSVSLGGAYHWNNTWGIGGEYKFRRFHVTGKQDVEKISCVNDLGETVQICPNAQDLLKGYAHQVDFYVSFDIFNAFRPQNKRKIFALDILAGGGALWTKSTLYYLNHYKQYYHTDFPFINDTEADRLGYNLDDSGKKRGVQSDSKYKTYAVFFGGISAEFNVNRFLEIGVRGLYNYSTSDNIDGRKRSNNNDAFFDCELLLRYKFDPRDKSNVRNFMVDEQIEKWNNGTYYEDPLVGAAKRKVYAPLKDTLYIVRRDTIVLAPAVVAPAVAPVVAPVMQENRLGIRNFVVFFDNDNYDLDKMALSISSEAALLLNQQTEYSAVVVGSCDNTGAIEYNKWLAVQRANNVANVLKEFGISSDRIYTVGRGIMQDDRAEGSFGINRRVEILIVNSDELAAQKDKLSFFEQNNNVKKTSAVRTANDENASSSKALQEAIQKVKGVEPQPATPEVKETPKAVEVASEVEVLDKVVVVPNMTLSQLAKQYYGNGGLWTKIFEANRDRLTSPDHLEEGVELIIPKLEK